MEKNRRFSIFLVVQRVSLGSNGAAARGENCLHSSLCFRLGCFGGTPQTKRCAGGTDSRSTLSLAVSRGRNTDRSEGRWMEEHGTAPYKCVFLAYAVKIKKRKGVYWLSTLCVILKCNQNPNWAYLLHIQCRQRAGATGATYLSVFGFRQIYGINQ